MKELGLGLKCGVKLKKERNGCGQHSDGQHRSCGPEQHDHITFVETASSTDTTDRNSSSSRKQQHGHQQTISERLDPETNAQESNCPFPAAHRPLIPNPSPRALALTVGIKELIHKTVSS